MTLPTMVPTRGRDDLLGWARRSDSGAFATLAVGERIAFPNPEALVALSAAAAVTERVRLAATAFVLPMHAAAWLAKQIATLDVVSGGRLTVAVGVGGREEDYRAVGAPFDRRHAYAERYLRVFGEGPAAALARRCTCAGEAALRDALGAARSAGADEVILVPTSADPAELERTLDTVAACA